MTTQTIRLRTPAVLAAELGVPLHRVNYVLRTRRHIRPRAVAGHSNLYDVRARAMVVRELLAIEAHRSGAGRGRRD